MKIECIPRTMHATITTDQGTLKVELFAKDAPNTVANFVKLAKEGFYNGLKFHRVIPGFVAQGGCPQGIGSGGPGYNIDCELNGENQFHDKGVLSMAHAGRNTGGSQFFLVHSRETTSHLDRQHTCFGKVTEGLDLVTQIAQGDTFSVEIVED
jgi:peptidyl-prolyl cis-trans isomerase B (cyclophilin B)